MRPPAILHLQLHGPPFHAGRAGNGAFRQDRRLPQPGVDRVQVGIAVGAVHDRLERRRQRQRVLRDVETEIRRPGLALHFDASQGAAELSGRRQGAGDALDRREVDVVERILPVNRRRARRLTAPGAETPFGLDLAAWNGIGQLGAERHAALDADALHLQLVDQELARLLPGAPRDEAQNGIRRFEPLDVDRRRRRLSGRVRDRRRGCSAL